MCGCFYLFSTGNAVADLFGLAGPVEIAPRYNIAPSQPVAVMHLGEHGRELVPFRRGLTPSWAKDAKFAPIMRWPGCYGLTERTRCGLIPCRRW